MEPSAGKKAPKRIVFWLLALIGLGLSAWAFNRWLQSSPLPFDRAIWDASRQDPVRDTRQHRMADAFVQSGSLAGKSRPEIVDMLGEPDQPAFRPEQWDMTFVLGACRHFVGIDTEFLALKFDASGKVVQTAIVED